MPPEGHLDWRETLILAAALRTGLLAGFVKRATPREVAARAGLDERAVETVVQALARWEYLARFGDSAVVTAKGKALLDTGGDIDPAGDVLLAERSIRNYLRLEDVLRGTAPVDDVSAGDARVREDFMRAMRHVASTRAPRTAELLAPEAPGARLLDVGGAPGTYGSVFAAAGWDVTVFDQPEMLTTVAEDLRGRGLRSIGGDVRQELPDGPWDAIYLGNVLHLFHPEIGRDIVQRAGAALTPGGRLAIQEMMIGHAPQAESFAVMMLVSTGSGTVHDERTYRDWMVDAGIAPESLTSLDDDEHQLLIGRRR